MVYATHPVKVGNNIVVGSMTVLHSLGDLAKMQKKQISLATGTKLSDGLVVNVVKSYISVHRGVPE